jgi:hypothetical protein
MGDEVGIGLFHDEVRLKARDHARSPVQVSAANLTTVCGFWLTCALQWNSQSHAGFSAGVPWMRVNDDYTQWNAEEQIKDPASILSHWRRVLELRRQRWDVFIYGSFEMVDRDHPSVFVYKRICKAVTATIVANFTDDHQEWLVSEDTSKSLTSGTMALCNYETPSELRGRTMSLRPFESFVVLEQAKASKH